MLAGVFNASIATAWNLCFLSINPVWMSKIQREVDDAIDRHRLSQNEEIADILRRLSLESWETEFPLLRQALKETLRFTMSGPMVRKNISNKDIPIPNTGSVIPRNSLAVCIYGQLPGSNPPANTFIV